MADEELDFSGRNGQNRGQLINYRITKRTSTEASNANPSVNSNLVDMHLITALAVAMTSFTVTGTPTQGQELLISITDNGTARALTFGSNFEASAISLPTTTVISQRLDMRFIWNSVTSKWRLFSITASGGGGGDATLGTPQTFTALKTFNQGTSDPDINIGNTMYGWGGGGTPSWGFNAYQAPGGWKYKSTNPAFLLEYNQGTGDFTLYNAPSGTVDTAIAWTARQTINSSNVMTLATSLIVSNGISGTKIDPRIITETSNTSPNIVASITDVHLITALAGNIATPITWSGTTPVNGQPLIISITDNGVARTLSWESTKFEASGGAILPLTTVAGVRRDIVFIYNVATGKFRMLNIGDVSKTGVETLTNKRVTKRAPTVTQSATPTINTDVTDVAHITGLAQNITSFTTNLSGTPVEGDTLRIDITDNGTARTIAWGSSFESSGGATLPTTTVISTRLDIGFVWNTVTSKWRCIAVV